MPLQSYDYAYLHRLILEIAGKATILPSLRLGCVPGRRMIVSAIGILHLDIIRSGRLLRVLRVAASKEIHGRVRAEPQPSVKMRTQTRTHV